MLDESRSTKIRIMITLKELNEFSEKEAFTKLEECCVSTKWITAMVSARPFSSEEGLINKAASIWFDDCDITAFKEAFTGHPKIGDVKSLQEKFAHSAAWAGNEQAKVEEATIETIEALTNTNEEYEAKFGYIFIVSASGKSATEMLAIVTARLLHNVDDEIYVAMNEQHKITVIRLAKLITGLSEKVRIALFLEIDCTTELRQSFCLSSLISFP